MEKAVQKEVKKTEVAVKKDNSPIVLDDGYTGLEAASSINDIALTYLRLLQDPDEDIENSAAGCLVDTLENKVFDISKEPVEVVPLMARSVYEIYEPEITKGRLHDKNFGEKIDTVDASHPVVAAALATNERKGTRRSYIYYGDSEEVTYLVQPLVSWYVFFNDDFYLMQLRGSKINFSKKWNRLCRTKSMPICNHVYNLSSKIEHNPIADAHYWNYDVSYKGTIEKDKVERIVQLMQQLRKGYETIEVQGYDDAS